MLAKVRSAAVLGVDAFEVNVEIDISGGLPSFMVVGLPDAAVQESRERVRAAIRNSELPFPPSRIVVNLAPADVRKEGPAFDLPIALAVLAAQGAILEKRLKECVISGELALNGEIRPIRGAINIGLFASQNGIKHVIVPKSNAPEVAVLDDIEALGPSNLKELVAFLQHKQPLTPVRPTKIVTEEATLDILDVKGQASAKRALELAAAGSHNLLMSGPPGSGKTMLARRLPGLMPPLTRPEAIEVTRIHSTAGVLKQSGLIQTPIFRAPHHTVSHAGLVGGGSTPRPGEISLAHKGILFMDEFPEFDRGALEVLRQPLEDGVVTISRARASLTFPAEFLLIASQNPCPCGHYGDPGKRCSCTPTSRQRYRDRISGPLMDRIDMLINVPRLSADELVRAPQSESSAVVQARVIAARQRMLARQGVPNGHLKGQALREHLRLSEDAETFMHAVAKQLALSGRGFDRLARVSRTIADLGEQDVVSEGHVAEAVSYREQQVMA